MSWKPEVIADSSGKWISNGLRFATESEAESSACYLMLRWASVREYRVTESEDPVNYVFDGRDVPLPPEAGS